jgi:hypothetical protein
MSHAHLNLQCQTQSHWKTIMMSFIHLKVKLLPSLKKPVKRPFFNFKDYLFSIPFHPFDLKTFLHLICNLQFTWLVTYCLGHGTALHSISHVLLDHCMYRMYILIHKGSVWCHVTLLEMMEMYLHTVHHLSHILNVSIVVYIVIK